MELHVLVLAVLGIAANDFVPGVHFAQAADASINSTEAGANLNETAVDEYGLLLNCTTSWSTDVHRNFTPTCSRRADCELYGDCCNSVNKSETALQFSKPPSCVTVSFDDGTARSIFVIATCNTSWPEDNVTQACENWNLQNETFFQIHATGVSGRTYRNGFCALCNYDAENITYWTATTYEGNMTLFKLLDEKLEATVKECNWVQALNGTCPGNSTSDLHGKCRKYLEPVRQDGASALYKNIYCAACNHINGSSLTCTTQEELTMVFATNRTQKLERISASSRNSSAVERRPSCASWYDGKCYIEQIHYHFKNASTSNATNKTAAVSDDESYTYTFNHYMVMVCIGISLFFLLMKGVTYVFFGASRSFASRCNLCLSATLFATQLLYILTSYLDVSDPVCVGSSVAQHYGFVATFTWTTVLSFDMWRNIATMTLAKRHDRTFVIYCVIAWGAPLLLVAICCMLNWLAPWSSFSPAYGLYYCFFGKFRAYIAFFLVPMGALLLVDVGLYIHIIIYVRRTSYLRNKTTGSKTGHQPSDVALFFKLALIMGATWFLGLLSFIDSTVIQVLTSIFTGLQGVYLFFGFQDHRYFCPGAAARRKRNKKLGNSNTSNTSKSSNLSNSAELQTVREVPAGVWTVETSAHV